MAHIPRTPRKTKQATDAGLDINSDGQRVDSRRTSQRPGKQAHFKEV